MLKLLIPLLATISLPTAVNAESSWNDKPICILTNEHSSDYKIKIYQDDPHWTGILFYKDKEEWSLTFDMTNGYGTPYFIIEKFSKIINPYSKYYYTGQESNIVGESGNITGNETRSGRRVRLVGNVPVYEYTSRSEDEKKKVKGSARTLLTGLGAAFHYIPTSAERQKFYKIRDGEWFRVSNNFWVKDKNNCEPRAYLFL